MADYFGAEAMIPVHQGVKTLSEPMKRCGNDLESKRIIYNNHPIDGVYAALQAMEYRGAQIPFPMVGWATAPRYGRH